METSRLTLLAMLERDLLETLLEREPFRDPVRDPYSIFHSPYSNETLLRSGLQSDSRFTGHPANNFNMIDGSYSIFTIL